MAPAVGNDVWQMAPRYCFKDDKGETVITIPGQEVKRANGNIPIEVSAGKFELIVRPVSDEERLIDQGMNDRYWLAKDPLEAGAFHAARYMALLNVVVGWKGVVTETPQGPVDVPFSRDALRRLLAVESVGRAVADALTSDFNNG